MGGPHRGIYTMAASAGPGPRLTDSHRYGRPGHDAARHSPLAWAPRDAAGPRHAPYPWLPHSNAHAYLSDSPSSRSLPRTPDARALPEDALRAAASAPAGLHDGLGLPDAPHLGADALRDDTLQQAGPRQPQARPFYRPDLGEVSRLQEAQSPPPHDSAADPFDARPDTTTSHPSSTDSRDAH